MYLVSIIDSGVMGTPTCVRLRTQHVCIAKKTCVHPHASTLSFMSAYMNTHQQLRVPTFANIHAYIHAHMHMHASMLLCTRTGAATESFAFPPIAGGSAVASSSGNLARRREEAAGTFKVSTPKMLHLESALSGIGPLGGAGA